MDGCIDRTDQMLPLLSNGEKSRSEQFFFERDRRRYILRMGILRIILGAYLEINSSEIQFQTDEKGKPSIADHLNSERFNFSLSHSSGMFICAFARQLSIGIDIEKIHYIREMDGMVRRFFSPGEIHDYFLTPESARTEAFFRCWTRKEAFLKATGDGLLRPLNSFSVSLLPEEPPRIADRGSNRKHASEWFVRDLPVEGGYAAAVVVDAPGRRIRCRCWPDDSMYGFLVSRNGDPGVSPWVKKEGRI